jgi:cob(I)alamin adenosyltransferase
VTIRINRVYTRTGDSGETGLVGGSRIAKDDLRIACYGEVDELNSVLGVVRSTLAGPPYSGTAAAAKIDAVLAFVQQELFDVGSELATPRESEYEGMIRIGDASITRLEQWMDELGPDLPELKSFVLPGGGAAASMLHVARTVCRRSERAVTTLMRRGDASANAARYLNRLSDLLFVQSRWIALETGHAEVLWQHGLEPPPPGRRARGRASNPGSASDRTGETGSATSSGTAASGNATPGRADKKA